jgi:hypothetical protein
LIQRKFKHFNGEIYVYRVGGQNSLLPRPLCHKSITFNFAAIDTGFLRPIGHTAIIDPELWRIVEDKLAANRHERSWRWARRPSLLAGLIVVANGNRMTPTHATRHCRFAARQSPPR